MKIILTLLTLFLLVSIVGCEDTQTPSVQSPDPDTTVVSTPPTEVVDEDTVDEDDDEEEIDNLYVEDEYDYENYQIDYANFTQFSDLLEMVIGTHVDDAISVHGSPTSELTMELFDSESRTLSWWTHNGWFSLSTTMTVTFTDGYATSIMETTDASSVFSQDDAEAITTGMSELEVFEILGMPYSITHMYLWGYSTTVMWIDSSFNSISVTFTNGVVSSLFRM